MTNSTGVPCDGLLVAYRRRYTAWAVLQAYSSTDEQMTNNGPRKCWPLRRALIRNHQCTSRNPHRDLLVTWIGWKLLLAPWPKEAMNIPIWAGIAEGARIFKMLKVSLIVNREYLFFLCFCFVLVPVFFFFFFLYFVIPAVETTTCLHLISLSMHNNNQTRPTARTARLCPATLCPTL